MVLARSSAFRFPPSADFNARQVNFDMSFTSMYWWQMSQKRLYDPACPNFGQRAGEGVDPGL